MNQITLTNNQVFNSRAEIGNIFGGDQVKGIVVASNANAILLFTNEEELYVDYFYPKASKDFCLYTGIGRVGHQDAITNNMYHLNIDVLNHIKQNKVLLLFEKKRTQYKFIGKYQLTETHQNIQPDDENNLRRVFVFHLEKISDTASVKLTNKDSAVKNNSDQQLNSITERILDENLEAFKELAK